MESEASTTHAEVDEGTEEKQPAGEGEQRDAPATADGGGSEGDTSRVRRVVTTGAAAGAVAAVVGVGVVAARRALGSRESSGGGESDGRRGDGRESTGSSDTTAKAKEAVNKTRKRGEALAPTMKAAGRELVKQNLIPVAETAAATAGNFAATSAPDIVRDRIVPKFIAAFNEARGD